MSRLVAISIAFGLLTTCDSLRAQPSRSRAPVGVRQLEGKAQEARQQYLAGLAELATVYDQSGETEKAQATLKEILKVAPDNEAVKSKLEELENRIFDERKREFEVDASKGWISTGLRVTKGQPVRLAAEGSYKFIVNADLGPDGFPSDDVMRDMGAGVNCGALMATIMPEPTQRNRKPSPSKAIMIGAEKQFQPEMDGVLLLRLNVPPNARCIGKVKVRVMGNIETFGT